MTHDERKLLAQLARILADVLQEDRPMVAHEILKKASEIQRHAAIEAGKKRYAPETSTRERRKIESERSRNKAERKAMAGVR